MGMYATVLFVLGMHDGISELADRRQGRAWTRLAGRASASACARALGGATEGRHASAGRRRLGRGMMDTPVLVHVDLRGVPIRVGRLWIRVRSGRESASFEYDPAWMDHPLRFALEPALTVGPGPYHTRGRLFGSIGDSAPDRWGRVLLRRAEVRRARSEGRGTPDPVRIRFPPSRGRRSAHGRAQILDTGRRAVSRRSGRGARSSAGRSAAAHGGFEEGTPSARERRRSSPADRSRVLPRRRTAQGRGQGCRRRPGAGQVPQHGGRPGHRALGGSCASAREAFGDSGPRMAAGNRCRKTNPDSPAIRPRGNP